MFLAHLETPLSNGTKYRLTLVEAVFRDLTQVIVRRDNPYVPNKFTISAISDSWPAICSSLGELHAHHKDSVIRISRPSGHVGHQQIQVADVASVILAFIHTISHWPDMTTTLRSPRQLQQITTILASVWTSERLRGGKHLYVQAAETIVSYIQRRQEDIYIQEFATSFIEGFDTKPVLGKFLLGHLETSFKSQAPYFRFDALLIGLLITADDDLKVYLLSQSSIRKFMVALKWFLSQSPSAEVAQSINLCLTYFVATLDATDGFTWVKQALRAKILPALHECSCKFLQYEGVEKEVFVLISRTISRYLVYKSVLREAKESLDDMESDLLTSPISTEGRVRDAWSNFIKLVDQRRGIKEEYNNNVKYINCASPQVCHDHL